MQNADNPGAYLDNQFTYTYDPRDRIAKTVKTPVGGGAAETETYLHDPNSSVYDQTVHGERTEFTFDRNRLMTSTTNGATATYNYDPYGRLRTITGGGKTWEKYTYDGFDHLTKHEKLGTDGTTSTVTTYTYDPLDRTTSKTEKTGTAGAKTTDYSYLGMSGEVLDEEVAGKLTRSFQYSPWGERLSQVKFTATGGEESSYYGYNAHTDVEQVTSETGDTRATYGYTSYGKNDDKLFTGVDKPDPVDPTTKEEYNPYRFNGKRWDNSTGMYDMGFRDYNPNLNRFLTLDYYNGALNDLTLGTDPWTSNRYAFAGGNPITGIELDGHQPLQYSNSAAGAAECQNRDCTSTNSGGSSGSPNDAEAMRSKIPVLGFFDQLNKGIADGGANALWFFAKGPAEGIAPALCLGESQQTAGACVNNVQSGVRNLNEITSPGADKSSLGYNLGLLAPFVAFPEGGEGVLAPEILAARTAAVRSPVLGFNTAREFEAFGNALQKGLGKAGYNDAVPLFQGSSVTGKSYRTGVPFDEGRVSDFDVALASPGLLAKARAAGIPLRSGKTRTINLSYGNLRRLGLYDLSQSLSRLAGRPVNFMIYESVEAAASRSPSVIVR
ncbi:RHS repeat-associated core domain-containing protein [Microbispora catharanthi]|uniref:RHS repeat-associated core domain-containing protein n=1 Tax=Microbispora catharanthi TaxID=1712871 RepID=UPI00197B2073|nr:RHS repeat-associated core domain-containing protein [Microbispora catharanthi]